MAKIIETANYTLTVYSSKADIDRIDNPTPLQKDGELELEIKKEGLAMMGRVEVYESGRYVDCKDGSGKIVRVKVTAK